MHIYDMQLSFFHSLFGYLVLQAWNADAKTVLYCYDCEFDENDYVESRDNDSLPGCIRESNGTLDKSYLKPCLDATSPSSPGVCQSIHWLLPNKKRMVLRSCASSEKADDRIGCVHFNDKSSGISRVECYCDKEGCNDLSSDGIFRPGDKKHIKALAPPQLKHNFSLIMAAIIVFIMSSLAD